MTAAPFAGRHVLAELTGVDAAVLDDENALGNALARSLAEAGARVLEVVTHRFTPHGVTVLALLAESHASMHTWPEHGAAFVDVFTCGHSADPERAARLLGQRLGASELCCRTVLRGEGRAVHEPLARGLQRIWDVTEVVWAGHTGFQDMLVVRTAHGITLFCDGERQSSEASQLVYHEALVVPALLLAERLDDVLVIGSSEGVVSRLAVAAGARRVEHVDIDAECVRRCAELLPYGYDPAELQLAERGEGAVRIHFEDGWDYLAAAARAPRRFDVVVLDLPDERAGGGAAAQHNRLYGIEALRLAAALLTDGGVLVSQAGSPTLWRNETLLRSFQRFGEVFPTVVHYGCDEHEWSFLTGCATPRTHPVQEMTRRLATLPYRPIFLDGDALRRGVVPPHAVRRERLVVERS